jgi:hypothetical protein
VFLWYSWIRSRLVPQWESHLNSRIITIPRMPVTALPAFNPCHWMADSLIANRLSSEKSEPSKSLCPYKKCEIQKVQVILLEPKPWVRSVWPIYGFGRSWNDSIHAKPFQALSNHAFFLFRLINTESMKSAPSISKSKMLMEAKEVNPKRDNRELWNVLSIAWWFPGFALWSVMTSTLKNREQLNHDSGFWSE